MLDWGPLGEESNGVGLDRSGAGSGRSHVGTIGSRGRTWDPQCRKGRWTRARSPGWGHLGPEGLVAGVEPVRVAWAEVWTARPTATKAWPTSVCVSRTRHPPAARGTPPPPGLGQFLSGFLGQLLGRRLLASRLLSLLPARLGPGCQ